MYQSSKCQRLNAEYLGAHAYYYQTAFWDYFEIGDLLTDALLIIIPGAIVVNLHTKASRKLRIMFFFALRTV